MRNLTIIKTPLGESSYAWMKVKPLYKVVKNWILYKIALIAPGRSNQFFYRAMGMKIGKDVQIMPCQMMDIFFPELITIGDGVVIGIDSMIICHEFNPTEFRYGPVNIGERVLIGARSFVLPGVNIGAMATVSAQTVVYQDIPLRVVAFGSPLQFKPIKEPKN